MSLRSIAFFAGSALALTAVTLVPADASACGGCFHPEEETESTIVTGHRMALSISPTQTVLWDQVEYAGNPAEFAWVLPVKPGAYVEIATDAFFEALDAATTTVVSAPQIQCAPIAFATGEDGEGSNGCGCPLGMADYSAGEGDVMASPPAPEAPPPVDVVHRGSVGPYDTVTLHANEQGALTTWLTSHNFAIDASVQPIIDAYTAEGFDFIALRLQPGKDVQQMKPVRVISPGASPTLPLRMVAAGTGARVDITLFVIGEGRWQVDNFPDTIITGDDLSWDFATSASTYSQQRQAALAENEGHIWLNTFSRPRALLTPMDDPNTGAQVQYTTQSSSADTIANLYAAQAFDNGESDDLCLSLGKEFAESGDVVVDVCPPGGELCGTLEPGQIDARELACGHADDLAVALTGIHVRDVWLTRIESSLPREALKEDLSLAASAFQFEVQNRIRAQGIENPPCELAGSGAAPPIDGSSDRRTRNRIALFAVMIAALGATAARRARRPLALIPARASR